jgi:ubiquinone biosynthesis monooxygenase Coq7
MTAMIREPRWEDRVIDAVDQGLKTLTGHAASTRESPAHDAPEPTLDDRDRQRSIALMRVNHAGEVAAQALYHGQSLLARSERTRAQLRQAADEERDHLAWCAQRLRELGGRGSLLGPAWYAGSAAIGLLAACAGDRFSLGFVAETERQVEAHLDDHLARLPESDTRSRLILERMREEEARHGAAARLGGGAALPTAARRLMAFGGGLLRRIALVL